MANRKVILDVDTGTDDAIAILLAVLSKKLDVLGVTTVNGNRSVDHTTENTLRIMELLDKDIKVYRGASLPLVVSLTEGRRKNIPFIGMEDEGENVHGDYLNLPEATIKEEDTDAVSWIVDVLSNSKEKITLIPVGPLTNIAAAIRIKPSILDNVEEIVIMGGGFLETNSTPSAEFNFWIDPEAAKIVINSGAKITLVPLDATHAATVSTETITILKELDNKFAKYISEVMEERLVGYNNWQPMEDTETVPIHDALAVLAVIDKKVLQDVEYTHVDVDISGGLSDGQSVVDLYKKNPKNKPNVSIALSADVVKFRQMIVDILKKLEEE